MKASADIEQKFDMSFIPNGKWAVSENKKIAIHSSNGESKIITTGKDFKPSWSPDGNMLTFFRASKIGQYFQSWRTKICVVKIDGEDFRCLTSGRYADFNPTWTRDGKNQIIFNRYTGGKNYKNEIYLTSPDASSGDEVLISEPGFKYFEWADSALKDGRIFVNVITNKFMSFLLTPKPGKKGRYQRVKRPTNKFWHKLSISPSETKVTYMLDNDSDNTTYEDVVIAYADFDIENLIIYNQKIITINNDKKVFAYPRWSKDENFILYDSNISGFYKIYAYRLSDGVTKSVSPNNAVDMQFPHYEATPK